MNEEQTDCLRSDCLHGDLISVIVPVYNVESYLVECVDSILRQSYGNIEVLLVDDGSTDSSSIVCDEYSSKDRRVRVVHKKNGGLSEARNCGLSLSKGKYVAFIDSDDFVSPFFIEALYRLVCISGSRIACVPCGTSFVDGQEVDLSSSKEDGLAGSIEVMSCHEALEKILYQDIETGVQWRLYSRDLLGDSPFPVGLLYEDLASVYKLIEKADGMALLDNPHLYAYRLRKTGIILGSYRKEKAESSIKISRTLYEDISKSHPLLADAAASRCFSVNRMVFAQIPASFDEDRRVVWGELVKYRLSIVLDSEARVRERIAALISFFGMRVFVLFCYLCRKTGLMR